MTKWSMKLPLSLAGVGEFCVLTAAVLPAFCQK